MKKYFSWVIIFSLKIFSFCIIPKWNLANVGENLLASKTEYNYTIELESNGTKLEIIKQISKINNGIKYQTHIKINNNIYENVSFDYVESFYNISNHIIVCPKGAYHPFNLTIRKEIIPNDFKANGINNWDLKCNKHIIFKNNNENNENNENNDNFFLVFYLNNDNTIVYYRKVNEDNWSNRKADFIIELYDFKLEQANNNVNNGEYPMMILANKNNNLIFRGMFFILKNHYQNFNQAGEEFDIYQMKNYTRAYFNISTNTYYFITYDNISSFISGYYNTSLNEIKIKGFNDWKPKINNITPFEFLEAVEIEEMNFILYNKFIYYKIKSINDKNKIYHGILDIITNKIVFNTDEEITKFIPYSNLAMLAITPTAAYKICIYKDNDGNCVEECNNQKYKLDIDGNTCNINSDCTNGKKMLIPSQVCIDQCDESIYVKSDNECGLCKDMNSEGKSYKLINGTECIEFNKDTMEYYNEKLNLLRCRDWYKIEGNTCISNNTCYELCEKYKCTESSNDINNQHCTECIDEYLLFEGNCNTTCPDRYKAENSTKECIKCSDDSCKSFVNNTCNCIECEQNYFINSTNSCQRCSDNNCKSYLTNTCNCTKCQEKFFINSTYLCEKCIDNCFICNNSMNCEECVDDYYINENGTCSPCLSNNCKETEDDKCKCKSCHEGFFLGENKICQKCDENCQNCDLNKNNCTSCVNGKFLTTENKCKNCDEKCLTCEPNPDNQNDICLSCKNDTDAKYKYLINDDFNRTCVENCTYYGREFTEDKTMCKPMKNESKKENETDKERETDKEDEKKKENKTNKDKDIINNSETDNTLMIISIILVY